MTVQDNPYKPPAAEVRDMPSAIDRLYSPGQIAGAAFLGSPIAGCWLLASNFGELGRLDDQRKSIVGGLVATVALVAAAFLLPDNFPNSVLPVAYTVVLHQLATKLQGASFRAHLEAGGRKHSHWRVVGIGLGFLVLVLLVLFGILLLLPESLVQSVASTG